MSVQGWQKAWSLERFLQLVAVILVVLLACLVQEYTEMWRSSLDHGVSVLQHWQVFLEPEMRKGRSPCFVHQGFH